MGALDALRPSGALPKLPAAQIAAALTKGYRRPI